MITIVNLGIGNVKSIANMLKKVGVTSEISNDPEVLNAASKLILPGVGAFDEGMKSIDKLGLRDTLDDLALSKRVPILGVCLGMQMLTRGSEEGKLPGLGWIDAEAIRFRMEGENSGLKVPHMGWNRVYGKADHPLFQRSPDENRFYFVHSYKVVCDDDRNVLSTTEYGGSFCSGIVRDNIMGVQFHPEKSHKFGMHLMKNFGEM